MLMKPTQPRVIIALDPYGRAIMTRDMELVRTIMLKVQARADLKPRAVQIEGVDPVILARHIEMLIEEKLVEGQLYKSLRGPSTAHITDLSWSGHDFIAALQNETVWGQLKQKFSPAQLATLPLSLVKDLGLEVLRRVTFAQLGEG